MARTPYPISIEKLRCAHQGGTKEYFLTVLTTADGLGAVIKRWGKVGKAVQKGLHVYDSAMGALDDFHKFQNERTARGYKINRLADVQANNEQELVAAVGRTVWSTALTQDFVAHLDPTIDVTRLPKELDANEFDENGEFIGRAPVRKVEVSKEAVREAETAALKDHPLFGMF